MVESLQKRKLVIDHRLVALDVLLEDNLDGDLSGRTIRLPYNSVGSGALGFALGLFIVRAGIVRASARTQAHTNVRPILYSCLVDG